MICDDNSVTGLISSTYPHIDHHQDDQYYLDRTILSGKNSDVEDINSEVLQKCPGEEKILQSADSVISDDGNPNGLALYPMEYLNSLRASSLPLAKLALKIGVPVMLLRNLDTTKGLCNGTRMIVTHISTRVLRCRIISGDAKFAGSIVLIPRINMDVSEEDLPIPLCRRQFPVRLAFAMTINKSQGQSVKHVGLDLRSGVFSHGQLYVALSRCTSGDHIKVILDLENTSRKTANIVYQEILNGLQM
ncbi:ATP-dependent DNA helicase PIF1 [Termitomyces sp. J132]|nr:ATP-dependent DNA helicase PIF1 [Termitomyces sp. J132]